MKRKTTRPKTARNKGGGGDGRRWVVLVAREQPALREHMCRAFAADDQVRIIEATEADEPKHSEKIARGLRSRGAVILKADDYESTYVKGASPC